MYVIGPFYLKEQPGSEMQSRVDAEVGKLLREAHDRVKILLKKHEKALHALANALLEYETLNAEEVKKILLPFRVVRLSDPDQQQQQQEQEQKQEQEELALVSTCGILSDVIGTVYMKGQPGSEMQSRMDAEVYMSLVQFACNYVVGLSLLRIIRVVMQLLRAFNTEAAHAIHKATIMPRGSVLGMVGLLPSDELLSTMVLCHM